VYRVIDWAAQIENTAVGRALDAAIQWVISAARAFRDRILNRTELAEAAIHRKTLQTLSLPAVQAKSLGLTTFLLDLMEATTIIAQTLQSQDEIRSLDHYLRLRAAQKLTTEIHERVKQATTTDDLSEDDLFLTRVSYQLVAENPELSAADVTRFEALVEKRFGMKMLPFVFNEMIGAWERTIVQRKGTAKEVGKEVDVAVIRKRHVDLMRKRMDALPSVEEQATAATLASLSEQLEKLRMLSAQDRQCLTDLTTAVARAQKLLTDYSEHTLRIETCANVAAGFLAYLEHPEAFADRQSLMDRMSAVGELIVKAAQFPDFWGTLDETQQRLIQDYANMFEEERIARAGLVLVEVQ
jgi:hypothetical protein